MQLRPEALQDRDHVIVGRAAAVVGGCGMCEVGVPPSITAAAEPGAQPRARSMRSSVDRDSPLAPVRALFIVDGDGPPRANICVRLISGRGAVR